MCIPIHQWPNLYLPGWSLSSFASLCRRYLPIQIRYGVAGGQDVVVMEQGMGRLGSGKGQFQQQQWMLNPEFLDLIL